MPPDMLRYAAAAMPLFMLTLMLIRYERVVCFRAQLCARYAGGAAKPSRHATP